MEKNDIGKLIRINRERLKYSIEELSFLSNVSKNHISKIERGEKIPKYDTLEKLANGLNMNISSLFSENNKIDLNLDIERIIPYLKDLNDDELEFFLNIAKNYYHIRKT